MIIRGGRLALPGCDAPFPGDVVITGGVIAAVGKDLPAAGHHVVDADGLLVLPGAIDPHVHFDEPGFTDREDFFHGTSAAAAGGVTTVVDMPCTSLPPVTSRRNLMTKLDVVSKRGVVDFGLFGGVSGQVMKDGYHASMAELAEWVLGYKTYFVSGMETFRALSHREFAMVVKAARALDRPVLLHAEDSGYVVGSPPPGSNGEFRRGVPAAGPEGPRDYYESRPEAAEVLAVLAACDIADREAGSVHIVHVSTGEAARIIGRSAHATGETAPHYLAFSLNDFESMGAALKVAPPVKVAGNQRALWDCLRDGSLAFVASDHAPAPAEQKNTGSIWSDYSGIPGTGTLLPYLFSQGYLAGRLTLSQLTAVTAGNAARRYGIAQRKGALVPGRDGDCVLIDPDSSWRVRGDEFLSKGKITPFDGMELRGVIERTIVRGEIVYDRQNGISVEPGFGVHVRRGTA